MNAKMWGTLPEQLIERVLSRLPFVDLIKMRCVCKAWNALILTGSVFAPNLKPKQVILCSSPGKLYLTSIPFNRSLSLSFLYPRRENLELVATDGGLLCLRLCPTDDFIVCNPMTKCWKKLPSVAETGAPGFWAVTGMLYEANSRNFKIVAAHFGSDGQSWGTQVLTGTRIYSSNSDSWSEKSEQDKPVYAGPGCIRKLNFHNKNFFHDNFLYVVKSEEHAVVGHAVLIFSLERKSWVELLVEDFTVDWRPAYLVCYRNQIYLVAEEEDSTFGFGTIGLWKLEVREGTDCLSSLDCCERQWVKVNTVYPGTLVSKNCKAPNFRWVCLGKKNLFCFLVTQNSPGGAGRNPVTEMVEYNLLSETWTQQWLAIHDVPNAEFFSFQPSISGRC